MRYTYVAQGLNRKKQFLVPVNEDVYSYISEEDMNKDWYTSIYNYEDQHVETLKTTGTLAGTIGIKTSKLVFDFDNENIDLAKADTLELIERLKKNGTLEEDIQICFSGGKGFSVEVQLDQELTRDEFKNVVFNLAKGLQTFDDKIHDYQRIFRLPLTKHQQSKLYKIPLVSTFLKETVESIKKKAENTDGAKEIMRKWRIVKTPEAINELKVIPFETPKEQIPQDDVVALDFSACPRWLSKEKYALLLGYIPESQRNHALMIIASTMRNQGFDKDHTLNILKTVVQKREKLMGIPACSDSQIHREIITQVYGPSWRGGMYSKDDPLLVSIRDKFGIKDVINDSVLIGNNELFSSFYDYALNIDKNTIKTGLPIDEQIRLTIGMPVALLGAPSSGKTSIALNILKNTSNAGIHSMFFSLDMHRSLVVQKQIQMLFGHEAGTIFNYIKDPKHVNNYKERLKKEFANVTYCCRSGLDVEGLRKEVEEKQRELNGDLKLVVIDYLECIKSQYSDQTASTGYVADAIKDIANDLNVCVVVLVQPPKITGGTRYPLTNMYQIKGSSMVAQAMRAVIGIYRVGFNPDNYEQDRYITFVCLKNTMGELFTQDCYWNGKTTSVTPIENYADLQEVREIRKFLLEESSKRYDA